MGSRVLVLWDVDYTLMQSGPIGFELYGDAFTRVTGQPLSHTAQMAGRTELAIFRDSAALHGIPYSRALFDRFADALALVHQERAAELAAHGRALPGAARAIATLAATGQVIQSVLTGNVRPVAEAKLAAFGLADSLDMEVGAYGTDDEDRAALVPLARDRAAAKYQVTIPATATVLIGDTPNDVRAAHANGVRVIAVASGHASADDLRRCGATAVMDSLEDTAAVTGAVLNHATAHGPCPG
ncbi:MAG TPA: haloacid dehalogenase-like hydrolase [Streptosporangiaceae bacterium]|nr:haloacid dehalogenase-like hydrolase [Streptosporangiaceae bacterium]